MRQKFLVVATCIALLVLVAIAGGPADAEIGPCRPAKNGGLICGERNFDMTLQVMQTPQGRGAKVLSVSSTRAQR